MRIARKWARLWRDERGSYALEFAMLAPLFLVLVLETVDIGLVVATQVVLDGAARDGARAIRTLQIEGAGGSAQTTFDQRLCNDSSMLIPCPNIIFYVNTMTKFSDSGSVPNFTTPASGTQQSNPSAGNFDPGGIGGQKQTFNTGAPGSLMAVRVIYDRPSLIPFSLINIVNAMGQPPGQMNLTSLNSTVIASTVIFRNEP
jgi:hypothetical protein